jgi:hypothetical protein
MHRDRERKAMEVIRSRGRRGRSAFIQPSFSGGPQGVVITDSAAEWLPPHHHQDHKMYPSTDPTMALRFADFKHGDDRRHADAHRLAREARRQRGVTPALMPRAPSARGWFRWGLLPPWRTA